MRTGIQLLTPYIFVSGLSAVLGMKRR